MKEKKGQAWIRKVTFVFSRKRDLNGFVIKVPVRLIQRILQLNVSHSIVSQPLYNVENVIICDL